MSIDDPSRRRALPASLWRGLLIANLIGASAGSVASAQDDTEVREITIREGEQSTISAVGVERFSEGRERIVDIRVTEREFILVALNPGETSLMLFYANGRQVRYNITVTARDQTAPPGTVEALETIRLDLYFVELNETYSHQIGLGFPGTIGGTNVGTANLNFSIIGTPMDRTPQLTTASLGLVNQVLPRLDLAQSQGWARLRRQAMVVTTNRTPARFASGGEVNIAIQGALVAEIRTIRYGSVLEMTPSFDPNSGRIQINITADLSELTEPGSPGDPPGRRRTELESVVNMRPGQAMMMSGLVSRSEQETQGGLPGLSQIPIVGVLFGTNQRRGEATQSVLFVVPTIVQPVPRQQRDYIEEAFETFSRFSGFIHDVEMFERTPPGYGAEGGRGAPAPTGRGDGD